MKIKLLSTLLFFTTYLSFSQIITGKVVVNNYAIANVEIINANSKAITISDANGAFSIVAKTNDPLVFISKEHQLKKIIINEKLFTQNELIVELTLNAEELNEVVITNMPSITLGTDTNWEQNKLDQYALENSASAKKVDGVYMGTIPNGMNLMRIGGMLANLFTKEKELEKKAAATTLFKEFAQSSCEEQYFTDALKLKPDEIGLFLEYCDADPRAAAVAEKKNVLIMMDFLLAKSTGFKTQ